MIVAGLVVFGLFLQHLQYLLLFERRLQGLVLSDEANAQQSLPLQKVDIGQWVFGLYADDAAFNFGRRFEVVLADLDQVVTCASSCTFTLRRQ